MISYLKGRVAHVGPDYAVIETGGIGFKCHISSSARQALPSTGEEGIVYTYLHLKEDGIVLYGFSSYDEVSVFERLLSVSGVGPKVALGLVSFLGADGLMTAVIHQDLTTLSKVPGVGKKTAQRLCIELGEPFEKLLTGSAKPRTGTVEPDRKTEVLLALENLGYSISEAAEALSRVELDPGEAEISEVIKAVLKELAKG